MSNGKSTSLNANYVRIMQGIFRRGQAAHATRYRIEPKCPYKRVDYKRMWILGYEDAARKVGDALANSNMAQS